MLRRESGYDSESVVSWNGNASHGKGFGHAGRRETATSALIILDAWQSAAAPCAFLSVSASLRYEIFH